MRPAIVYLIGHPAADKYTVARALAEQAEARGHRMVVVDNHHINNAIFGLLDCVRQDAQRVVP
jgi:adenylylsulfate kinase-like enzyme